jgi:serine/threonine-protein kinase
MEVSDGRQLDVWVYDWQRDLATRLTVDPSDDAKPVWTPDGQRIVFGSKRGDHVTTNLYWQRADGTGDVQRLTESNHPQQAASWHPSGKWLAFDEFNPETGYDIAILPMAGDETAGWKPGKPTIFLATPFFEIEPMFSPDGRWLAYVSNESGGNEVYVRPFPGPGGKWRISTAGGIVPTWSRTRRELFYVTLLPSLRIMVAPYTDEGGSFHAEKPVPWAPVGIGFRPPQRFVALHPDGQRFAVAPRVADGQSVSKQDQVVFVFNFFDELRRIAPVRH